MAVIEFVLLLFKQKTAYEMRISDWSSDVCSSDLDGYLVNAQGHRLTGYEEGGTNLVPIRVPTGNIAPAATGVVTSKVNVDANAPLGSAERRVGKEWGSTCSIRWWP